MQRPQPDEYAHFYETYISLVETGDIIASLNAQAIETMAVLSRLPESQGDFRYEPGKWSVKQVLGHINDSERIFAYRALRISRNDPKPMEGFEQNDYVDNGGFERRSLSGLIDEFTAIRSATVCLFANLEGEAWQRRGVANQNQVSVRALAWIIAGHELHHRSIVPAKYLAE
jgi:uncharacterized damage-inducible protein DinB